MAGTEAPSVLAPLRLGLFRRLVVVHTIGELGDWLALVALPVIVFANTGSPLATMALFLGLQFIPAFLAPALVARVEALDVRTCLVSIYALQALALLGLADLASNFDLTTVVLLAAASGTMALVSRTLTRTVAAVALGPEGLRAGNALLNVGFTAAGAIGPALAGLVLALWSATTALLLDAGTFAIAAAVFIGSERLPRLVPEGGGEPWATRLREGFGYVWRNVPVRRLVLGEGIAFVLFAITVPLDVVYVTDALGAPGSDLGFLLAAWGGGTVIGSLIFAAGHRIPVAAMLLTSTAAIGVSYIGLAAAPSLGLAAVAAAVGGAGNGIQWTALISAVQSLSSEQLQARVIGLLESIGAASLGVGFLLGGALAATVSVRAAYLSAGVGVLALVAVVAVSRVGAGDSAALEVPSPGSDPTGSTG